MVVHNAEGEPVVLRDALVIVWDALAEPMTETDVSELVSTVDPDAHADAVRREVHRALEALEHVGLAARVR